MHRLSPGSRLIDTASGEVFSGREVTGLILGFAAGFLGTGLRTGDRILLGCALNPASAAAYLGAIYAGLVPVPVDERGLAVSGEALAVKTTAKAVWTSRTGQHSWSQRRGLRQLAGSFAGCSPSDLPPALRVEGDLAALMPTSGSTGQPRLVRVTHGNLIANTEAIIRSQRLGPDERAMLILPVSYCFGASVLHSHLYRGGGVVFDSRFTFPDTVLEAINEFGCTTFAGVPTAFNILLRRSSIRSLPLPGLRRFLQAGGPLAPGAVAEIRRLVPHAEFFVMYGQTEATARIACLPPERLTEKLGSAGLPLDNLTVRIADEAGRELPVGQPGEIWVRGPSICDGYFEDPEDTACKFQDGWLKTGDLASLDDDGFLWIQGRKADFIKIRGLRVGLAEVEARVAAVAGVCECAAVGTPHLEAGEALALFVVADPGAEDIAGKVRRALPPQWTCASVTLAAALPRTSNGKLDRSQLI